MSKKIVIALLAGMVILGGCAQKIDENTGIKIDESVFPDDIFRDYVVNSVDTDQNGFLSEEEISAVTTMYLATWEDEKFQNITSLKGLELFTELDHLSVRGTGIKELDLSGNPNLTYLQCSDTEITSIDTSVLPKLRDLQVANTKVESVDVFKNSELEALDISYTVIGNLDLSGNRGLMAIHCLDCKNMTELNVKDIPHIQEVSIAGSGISSLDVTDCPEILCVTCDMDDEIIGCDERYILRKFE